MRRRRVGVLAVLAAVMLMAPIAASSGRKSVSVEGAMSTNLYGTSRPVPSSLWSAFLPHAHPQLSPTAIFGESSPVASVTSPMPTVSVQLSIPGHPSETLPAVPDASAQRVAEALLEDDPFDDVVALAGTNGRWCTGVMLSGSRVLTARHCLPTTRVLFAHRVTAPARAIAVTASHAHPTMDVAVLDLAQSHDVARHQLRADPSPPRGTVRLVGFGATDAAGHVGFGTMREGDAIVSSWGCTQDRARQIGCFPGSEMLIVAPNVDTCSGDSGGPVFERTAAGWRLLAITSRGASRLATRACGDGGVYERVDVLTGWLKEEIAR